MSKPIETTPAADLLLPSTSVIKDNLVTYFVLAVIPLLLSAYGGRDLETVADLFNPVLIAGTALSVLFIAPLTYVQVMTAKGKLVGTSEAFSKGFKFFWRLIGLGIVVGFLISLGFLLFVIPGVILLRRYFLSIYYLVDQNLDIKTAMKKSAESSVKKPGAVYGVIGITLLFVMFGVIGAVGQVISSILLLLYSVAPALRYHEMKKLNSKT